MKTINRNSITSVELIVDGACPKNGSGEKTMYCSFACVVNGVVMHRERIDLSKLDTQTNNVAEYYAVLYALSYMFKDEGRRSLEFVVETDSKLVVTHYHNNKSCKKEHLKPLLEKLVHASKLMNFKMMHVDREITFGALGH